jgi:hypothetical protein
MYDRNFTDLSLAIGHLGRPDDRQEKAKYNQATTEERVKKWSSA